MYIYILHHFQKQGIFGWNPFSPHEFRFLDREPFGFAFQRACIRKKLRNFLPIVFKLKKSKNFSIFLFFFIKKKTHYLIKKHLQIRRFFG